MKIWIGWMHESSWCWFVWLAAHPSQPHPQIGYTGRMATDTHSPAKARTLLRLLDRKFGPETA